MTDKIRRVWSVDAADERTLLLAARQLIADYGWRGPKGYTVVGSVQDARDQVSVYGPAANAVLDRLAWLAGVGGDIGATGSGYQLHKWDAALVRRPGQVIDLFNRAIGEVS